MTAIAAAVPLSPTQPQQPQSDLPNPPLLGVRDYLRLPRAPERWVAEGILPTGGWLMIHGAPKSGKSYAIMDLAAAVANGDDAWLSFPIKTHGKVVYLQLDTPRGEWANRIEVVEEGGTDLSLVHTIDREVLPGFDILDPNSHAWLAAWCSHVKPVLVVIDTFRKVFKGKENESDIADHVLSQIEAACLPAAMVLVHHSKKANPNPRLSKEDRDDPIENIRGSTALTGAMDTVMYLKGERLIYEGRSIESSFVKLDRLPNHHWIVGKDEKALIREIVGCHPQATEREQARLLHLRLPSLGEETARTKIRRFKGLD